MFVGWGLFFLFVLVPLPTAAPTPRRATRARRANSRKGTEVAVGIIEVALLIFYAIPAWATRVRDLPKESEAVVVRVVSEQFAWNVHYPGADGKFGRTDIKLVSADNPLGLDRNDQDAKDDITTINQLNLPVDRPVLVHLIEQGRHPQLRPLRNAREAGRGARPEYPSLVHPQPRPESAEIACSQLCGLGHFRMRGFVTIQSADDYSKWMADRVKELRSAN